MTRIARSFREKDVARVASSAAVDLDQVRTVLTELLDDGKKDEVLSVVLSLLGKMVSENRGLADQLADLVSATRRKSEKIDPKQLLLMLESLAPEERGPAELPEKTETVREHVRRRKGTRPTGRHPLPAHLPVEERIHDPAAGDLVCTGCGTDKKCIGSEKSDVLEYVPASLKVIRDVRRKWACPRGCERNVVIADVVDKPIEGGLPGPGLLSHLLVSKYRNHLPLNRLVNVYEQWGVVLARSTLCDWVRGAAELLEPVSDAIYAQAIRSHVLQVDDTGLCVLDRSRPDGSKRGHMWALVGDRTTIAFRYTETWKGESARALLVGREGWLQADAYKGFDRLFTAAGSKVREVACWAHCRRKFKEALDGGDVRAAVMIERIGKLFAIERVATEHGADVTTRLALRQERSRPIIDSIGPWIAKMYNSEPPKSPLTKGLTYTINQWTALTRFLEDGALQLDNNAAERALRAVAVGRKNWLFAGSDEGAQRAAIVYTVIATCVAGGIDPWTYLRDVLETLAGDFPMRRVAELLPQAWIESQPEARRADEPRASRDSTDTADAA